MKTIASIEGIRAEIQRRIGTSTWGRGWCSGCPAPFPYRILHDGHANWTAHVTATKAGCEGLHSRGHCVCSEEYDLPAQSLRESIWDFFSNRKPPF